MTWAELSTWGPSENLGELFLGDCGMRETASLPLPSLPLLPLSPGQLVDTLYLGPTPLRGRILHLVGLGFEASNGQLGRLWPPPWAGTATP